MQARKIARAVAVISVVSVGLLGSQENATIAPAQASTAPAFPTPAQDPFYASPAYVALLPNGAIIRSRQVSAPVLFLGMAVPATAWQVAYKSLDAQNNPVTDVTTIVVPTAKYTGTAASRPVISYQAAEDSTGSQCAPSYSLRTGSNILTGQEQSLIAYGLLSGYTMAIPDYEGPTSDYLSGYQSAHAVLDGIRAALQFSAAGITPTTQFGLWGYSGGGQATAWAAELQHSYAPELRLAGIAFGGAPVNLTNSFLRLDGSPYSGALFGGVVGLHNAYPQWDIEDQLNAAGRADIAMATNQCIINFGLSLGFKNIDSDTTQPDIVELPENQAIITPNNLGHFAPVSPIYDYYSTNDEAIPTADSQALVTKYCAEGVTVDAQPVPLSEHASLAVTKTPDVVSWLGDRFAGRPAPSTCQ